MTTDNSEGYISIMILQSLIDWWRLVRRGGVDPDTAEPIYPAPMSHDEIVALEKARGQHLPEQPGEADGSRNE